MQFEFAPMTLRHAKTIAGWHYTGIYSFYDLDQDPEDRREFLDSENWKDAYFAVVDAGDELVGFFSFAVQHGVVELGLGLRPTCAGNGLGAAFIEAGLQFAKLTFDPTTFHLSVAAFNQRAIRLYQQLGFALERVFQQASNGSTYEFVEMTRPPQPGGEGSCGMHRQRAPAEPEGIERLRCAGDPIPWQARSRVPTAPR